MTSEPVQLGLGLIGMGKPWGFAPHAIPSDRDAAALLDYAFGLGIRYFDTAPSYGDGVSERRLGDFLRRLSPADRGRVTVATKFGEHWNAADGEPYADHSLDALRRSLDRSVERLGRIDILQLHKTTPAALHSDDVARAWEYAGRLGIERIGPSVSDPVSARLAIDDPRYTVIQLPLNSKSTQLLGEFETAAAAGLWIAINRPLAMGAMAADRPAAFRFLLSRPFTGVILTGTTNPDHLRENWDAFTTALPTPPSWLSETPPDRAS